MHYKKFCGLLSLAVAATTFTPVFAQDFVNEQAESVISSDVVNISLSDDEILMDNQLVVNDSSARVYTTHSIIYYEDRDTYDSGNVYGEGTASDKHSSEEAEKHTVVTITEPGTYRLTGKLSYGQILVDVGKDEADKVTLILDGVDINCTVAPAILFYKVYECDMDTTTDTASDTVDTSNAGARVIIADDSVNNISGSYVAKIYKDTDAQKKLYKFDGAFYSRMSMEIDGEEKGNGILNINADNEGLDTEHHLTINGGCININSGDDGINVNEDGISVFTMNDGYLTVYAGNGSEGDGIDSNGWIVINGGTLISLANPKSPDGGIDSDMGATINGGTVIGAGNMYDPLEDSSNQLFMFLELAEQTDKLLTVTDENDNPIFAYDFPQNYTYIVFSTPTLTEGTYHVYEGGTITGVEQDGYYSEITSYIKGTQLHHGGTSATQGGNAMTPPDGTAQGEAPAIPDGTTQGEAPAIPDGTTQGETPAIPAGTTQGKTPAIPDGTTQGEAPAIPDGTTQGEAPAIPDGTTQGERPELPDGMQEGEMPGGGMGAPNNGMQSSSEIASYDFVLTATNRSFTNVSSSVLSDDTESETSSNDSTDTSDSTNESTTTTPSGTTDTSSTSSSSDDDDDDDSSSTSSSSSSSSSSSTSSTTSTTNTTSGSVATTETEEESIPYEHPFTDINTDDWYAEAVNFCYHKGLMLGTSDNGFSPSLPATREMFVTVLYRLANTPDVQLSVSFNDVKNTSAYYYKAIAWAKEVGITNGMTASTFGVGKSITVKDAVTMLNRYGKGNELSEVEHVNLTSTTPATRGELAELLMQYCK